MTPFTRLVAPAAPLMVSDLDTDQIFPARYMGRPRGAGLAECLLHDHRFDANGAPRPGFILNRPEYRDAKIILAGENFACGSAREQAVLALLDYGIKVVLAIGMGDIFASSAIENGLVATTLSREEIVSLVDAVEHAPGAALVVDLAEGVVIAPDGRRIRLRLPARQREMLIKGLDPVAQLLSMEADIAAFEARHEPWSPRERSA